MPVVRTDGRAGGWSVYGHVITKFSRMGSLPHFFILGASLRALRARELCYYTRSKVGYCVCVNRLRLKMIVIRVVAPIH